MNDWWIEMFIDGFNDNSFFETFISKHCFVNFFSLTLSTNCLFYLSYNIVLSLLESI